MILTRKTKEDFEKWYIKKDVSEDEFYNIWEEWSSLSTSCKNAFYIDFFDSAGIYITSDYFELNKGFYSEILNENFEIVKPTRQEALAEAIKKANEIYNEKYSISQ